MSVESNIMVALTETQLREKVFAEYSLLVAVCERDNCIVPAFELVHRMFCNPDKYVGRVHAYTIPEVVAVVHTLYDLYSVGAFTNELAFLDGLCRSNHAN